MQSIYDYKKFGILYVDDEEKSLKYFSRAFADQFRILTAPNAEEGFKVFEQNKDDIAILITDQRMPGEKGVQLLERVRQFQPRVIRMLATAYSDIEAAIAAVNSGAIYKYIHKPWDVPELEMTLKRALEFYMVQLERDHLLHEKLSVLQNMMITDRVISLGVLGAGIAHQVHNPLAAVRAFLETIPGGLRDERMDLEQLRNPNYWRDLYDHVQAQAHEVAKLLPEASVGASAGNGFPDQIALRDILARAVQGATELSKKEIAVENGFSESLPMVRGDRAKLQRAFDLLLSTEAARLPNGSRISVAAEVHDSSAVRIQVSSGGPLLPLDEVRAVLNPFSGKPGNIGLSLLTCFLLVHHHGGSVAIQNGESAGTVLTINLPLNPSEPTARENLRDFVTRVIANEALWDRLLVG